MMDRTATTERTIWSYPDDSSSGMDLTDFEVQATDGGIGKVHEASNEVSGGYIVVDTGPWIFGRKVLLPAGLIERVDGDERRVHVSQTKDQIQNAPEFDEGAYRDDAYRDEIGSYYGGTSFRTDDTYGAGVEGEPANRPAGPDYGRDDRTDPLR
ncbi:MAG: PRC-barrel domain-containing protein [Chloroflexota bacterium]